MQDQLDKNKLSFSSNIRLSSNIGFTLIEVIIAVGILSFISIFTALMIQQGLKAKTKIQNQIDRTSALTTTLQLMSRDIERAFNYRDYNVELYNAAQKKRKPKPTTPPGAPPPSGTLSPGTEDKYKFKEVKVFTRFMGEADKLNFTTLNNNRATKNLQQSDQAEVGYYLATCTGRIKQDTRSECLWRRTSPYIDAEITEGGSKSAILENVKSMELRYLGPGHTEEWVENWKTEGAETVMNNKFPYAVEITITVFDNQFSPPKEIAMTIVAALKFPNNKPDETNEDEKSNSVN